MSPFNPSVVSGFAGDPEDLQLETEEDVPMKSLALILVVLAVGILAGRLSNRATASAVGADAGVPGEAPEPRAKMNGDVNGDHGINIADAIYLLNFLFQGSDPAPVPFDCPELNVEVLSAEWGLPGGLVDVTAVVRDLLGSGAAVFANNGPLRVEFDPAPFRVKMLSVDLRVGDKLLILEN